jgi:hypothetical protein
MRRGQMTMLCATIAVAFSALGAPSAFAGTDHWFNGTMPAGFGFASTAAHSITYIEATGNFNGFCVAKDTGLAGYDLASRNVAGTRTCASSGGFASRTENGACCFHGWVDDSTANNILFDPSTHYSF